MLDLEKINEITLREALGVKIDLWQAHVSLGYIKAKRFVQCLIANKFDVQKAQISYAMYMTRIESEMWKKHSVLMRQVHDNKKGN